MPGIYTPPDYDLAGFIVGCVEEDAILGADRVCDRVESVTHHSPHGPDSVVGEGGNENRGDGRHAVDAPDPPWRDASPCRAENR